MAGIRFFKVHRTWEDWVGMVLGVLIGLSPWIVGQQDNPAVLSNAIVVGMLVFVLSQLEYITLQRWEEFGEIVLGLWLIASPFVFDYAAAGEMVYWHIVLGGIVVLLAMYELWQDWTLTDKEMLQHGH